MFVGVTLVIMTGCMNTEVKYTPSKTVVYESPDIDSAPTSVQDNIPPKIIITEPEIKNERGIAVSAKDGNFLIKGYVLDSGEISQFQIDGSNVHIGEGGDLGQFRFLGTVLAMGYS